MVPGCNDGGVRRHHAPGQEVPEAGLILVKRRDRRAAERVQRGSLLYAARRNRDPAGEREFYEVYRRLLVRQMV